ncbi:MAG: serine hydrolase [Candidatus Hydrogenedentes bacterium]|nr:serine hydrolase [Candidatus Hydrogenedentota bacterium]
MHFGSTQLLAACLLVQGLMPGAWPQEVLKPNFAELEARWESARQTIGLPGMAIAVVKDDNVSYERGFGYRDLDSKAPFTANTASYIASVTKTFVTFAVMQQVDAGRVDLDRPVKSYLPRFQLADQELTQRITVRDLLCHRFGLSNWPITFAEAYTGILNDDFFYRELSRTDVKGSWAYSNLHFTLLGRLVEAVTGQSWQHYLQEHVFLPAVMDHTTARASELYAIADHATPYIWRDGVWRASSFRKADSTMHAAGGIGSSAHDLALWILLHLNSGALEDRRLLSDAAVTQILTAQVKPKSRYFMFGRKEMGLGWYLGDYKDDLLVHHFGSYAGAHAHVSFMPEHKLGVAVVTNSDEDMAMLVHLMAADVYDAYLGRTPSRDLGRFVRKMKRGREMANRKMRELPAHTTALALPKSCDAYTGTYLSESWGILEISRDGDGLAGHDGNFPLSFYQDDRGDVVADTPLGNFQVEFIDGTEGGIAGIHIVMSGEATMSFYRCLGGPNTATKRKSAE